MASKIKAIETRYKGYRFRSRLEARWAVFLDTAGIKYEYETEGFKLDDGKLYLPDFWLPAVQTFIEVKGPEPTYEEHCKALGLVRGREQSLIIFCGNPWPNEHKVRVYHERGFGVFGSSFQEDTIVLAQCKSCSRIEVRLSDIMGEQSRYSFGTLRSGDVPLFDCADHELCWVPPLLKPLYVLELLEGNQDGLSIYAAYLAARAARFEHGEKG